MSEFEIGDIVRYQIDDGDSGEILEIDGEACLVEWEEDGEEWYDECSLVLVNASTTPTKRVPPREPKGIVKFLESIEGELQ